MIDNVLLPATKTIAQQLAAKPEYSIFVTGIAGHRILYNIKYG